MTYVYGTLSSFENSNVAACWAPKIFKKSRGYESNDEIYTTPPPLQLQCMIRKKSTWVIRPANKQLWRDTYSIDQALEFE